jgi:hypothetical protein
MGKHEKKRQKHKEKKVKHKGNTDFHKTISRNDKEDTGRMHGFFDCQTIFVENRITWSTGRAV